MTYVHRSAMLPYSVEQMYELVNDIKSYPEFIPWCVRCEVNIISKVEINATMYFARSRIKTSVTTNNKLVKNEKIDMHLHSGPFKKLFGCWTFKKIDENSCKVELEMEFEFSNKMYAMTIGPIFNQVANKMVSSFSQRAHEIYG